MQKKSFYSSRSKPILPDLHSSPVSSLSNFHHISQMRRPFLYYSNDDYKKILHLRKRNLLIRSLKIKEEFDPLAPHVKIKKLKRMYSLNLHRKSLKYLKTFSILQLSNTNIGTLLYYCRNAESIVIYYSMINLEYSWRNSIEFTKFRYILTKHTKRIEICHNDDGLLYMKKLLMMLRICKLKNIKGFSHINRSPVFMWNELKFQKLVPYAQRIIKLIGELPWLTEFYFNPLTLFSCFMVDYVKTLNRLKKIEKTCFSSILPFWWVEEDCNEMIKTYFSVSIPLNFLTHLTIDISYIQSIKLLEKIFTDAIQLKVLNLTYISLENVDYPEKLHLTFANLKTLKSLETIGISPLSCKLEMIEEITSFPISHFESIDNLRTLNFNNTFEMGFDMGDLMPILETLPNLYKLTIFGTQDNPHLVPFDKFDYKLQRSLEILYISIDYSGKGLTVDERFLLWMNANKNLKELELCIATKQELNPKLNANQLEILCEGIGILESLHYLKFCFGSASQSDLSESTILEGFADNNRENMVSNNLKRLLHLRRVILRIGFGYLCDGELRKILGWLKNCSKLQNLALELNCKAISEKGYLELVEFIQYSKVQMLLTSFLIKTHHYQGEKKEELFKQLLQHYQENVKFSSLDYF